MKKTLSLLLTFVLMVNIVSTIAFAANGFTETDLNFSVGSRNYTNKEFVSNADGTYTVKYGGDGTGKGQTGIRISSTKFGDFGSDKFILFSGIVTPSADVPYFDIFLDSDSSVYVSVTASTSYKLQVMVDLKNSKMLVYKDGTKVKEVTVGGTELKSIYFRSSKAFYDHDFAADEEGICTKCGKGTETTVLHGTSEAPAFVMSISDLTVKEIIPNTENATLDDLVKYLYPPVATVKQYNSETPITKNTDGSYSISRTGGKTTRFYVEMNQDAFLKNGEIDPSIKYVKTDFTINSEYNLKQLVVNNTDQYKRDTYAECIGKTGNLSIVWDVAADSHYIYSDNFLSGVMVDLVTSTKDAKYRYMIKMVFNDSSLPTEGVFNVGTISNFKQTTYGSGETLKDMDLYTNAASYTDGKYVITNKVYYTQGSMSGETNICKNIGVYYAGYDSNNEITFITFSENVKSIEVQSPEVEYIKTYFWTLDDCTPLMRAEGLVKITQ